MTRLLRAPLSDGSRFDELSGGAVLALRATAAAVAATAAYDGIEREDNEGISHRRLNELRGLERHRSAKSTDDLLELAARAAFVLQVLSMMGLVSGGDGVERAGELAMEALEAVQYNTHPIDQVAGRCSPEQPLTVRDIGSVLNPTLARLLNHSCDPNTLRLSFSGHRTAVLARRDIARGEEITDCYGMHYASTKSASERRKTLKKWFNFDCRCGACSGGGGYATEKRSVAAGDELLRAALADFKAALRSGDRESFRRKCIAYFALARRNGHSAGGKAFEAGSHLVALDAWSRFGNKLHHAGRK